MESTLQIEAPSIAHQIDQFALLFERESKERMVKEGFRQAQVDHDCKVTVKPPGGKYTKVDISGSGRFMIVNATGEIFGIKGYGVIHTGKCYGTLATVDEWYWGGYTPTKKPLNS